MKLFVSLAFLVGTPRLILSQKVDDGSWVYVMDGAPASGPPPSSGWHSSSDCTEDFAIDEYPNAPIPDNSPSCGNAPGTPVVDQIVIGEHGLIEDIDVRVEFDHTWIGDLQITVTHVDTGTSLVLWDQRCGSNSPLVDYDITFDDEGPITFCSDVNLGGVAPSNSGSGPLNVFNGENMYGTWELTVTDWCGADIGTLIGW
eukprot:CAMPEP_0197464414 /NCGR_PEP_ID=MMETSP1175-20131217/64012_1 /TAXON_ID=1003142 /ORGANISM="Triceratium dubium, Strain CCMP147" /LENGTH=199 /DNA_ID=CAMNT_0043000393 /DNA_START=135 /DNA_END=731 /DNA_ORIENTATION=-